MIKNISIKLILVLALAAFFSSCEELIDDPTPTHELMQGVWELTQAYDSNDNNFLEDVSNLDVPNLMYLNGTNGVTSTSAPLFMYIVYGKSRFVEVSSTLDNIFSYGSSDFGLTQGEWSLTKNKVTDHFAIEMKMKFPTAQSIDNILNLMGINSPAFIEAVIYHKFKNVHVEIDEENPNIMYWHFDDETIPEYNYKNENLDYVSWTGVQVNSFSRCSLTFEKRVSSIEQIVDEAYSN